MSIRQKLTTSPNSYLPAQLVKGRSKGKEYWYIKYYQTNPITGIRSITKVTMDLNRIKDPKKKTAYAKDLIDYINSLLPYGYPYHEDFEVMKGSASLEKSIQDCKRKIQPELSPGSVDSYKSMYNIFLSYLKDIGRAHTATSLYTIDDALLYMNHISEVRKVSNTTYNNYLTQMNVLFNKMIAEKYITVNPFSQIRRRKKSQKIRRGLHNYEVEILIKYMREDPPLLLCVLLQYYCFIRPSEELRKIRFQHFDLNKGCIHLPSSVTKNSKPAIITIPDVIIPFLREYGFLRYPQNYIIFGPRCIPHPTKSVGKNTLGRRHIELVRRLHKQGILTDIQGIQLYSWKDTGALAMIEEGYNIIDIKNQIRHSSLEVTQKYIKSLHDVNPNIKIRKKSLL